MAFDVEDLTELEIAFLGVLALGLPPARAAQDETFRIDHCTAVVMALREGASRGRYLSDGGPGVGSEFAERLRTTVGELAAKGILADQPAGMPAAPGGFEAGLAVDLINPDSHPVVLDRWLSQRCLDALLSDARVYSYLMGQYARAGEFWRRARAGGYGS